MRPLRLPCRPLLGARALVVALPLLILSACGGDDAEVSSDEEARRAYVGLNAMIDKAINLGMAGFSAATSANIPPQMAAGALSGTITISGQVDQGASANKTMNLLVALVGYSDGVVATDDGDVEITYDTDPAAPPQLGIKLMGIPDGTFTGTLMGSFAMTGDLEGSVTLNLTLSGEIESDGAGGILRTPGMTLVTGTATSGEGSYSVDVSI